MPLQLTEGPLSIGAGLEAESPRLFPEQVPQSNATHSPGRVTGQHRARDVPGDGDGNGEGNGDGMGDGKGDEDGDSDGGTAMGDGDAGGTGMGDGEGAGLSLGSGLGLGDAAKQTERVQVGQPFSHCDSVCVWSHICWSWDSHIGGVFAQRGHSANYYGKIIQVTTLKTTHLRNHAQSTQNSKIQTSDACHGSQGPKFCPL